MTVGDDTILVQQPAGQVEQFEFPFTYCASGTSPSLEGQGLDVLEGHHVTLLCLGRDAISEVSPVRSTILETISTWFDYITAKQDKGNHKYLLRGSCCLVGGTDVTDLLTDEPGPLCTLEDPVSGAYIDGLVEHIICSTSEAEALLTRANGKRMTCPEGSVLLTFVVERMDSKSMDACCAFGRLVVVDLPWSEHPSVPVRNNFSAFEETVAAAVEQNDTTLLFGQSPVTAVLKPAILGQSTVVVAGYLRPKQHGFEQTAKW